MGEDDDWSIPASDLQGEAVELGKGAFGTVFLRQWRRTEVAVKVIAVPTASATSLFRREFEVMTRMHHPNIVQLLGYVDTPFSIVMEYLSGGSLAERAPGLSERHKWRVCLDILRGLVYMHNRKPHRCIHRDVKPRNILLTRSGSAKLADLGLSKLVLSGSSENLCDVAAAAMSSSVGTERYAAPETRGAAPSYGTEIDVYSCGAVFYELFEQERLEPPPLWALCPPSLRPLIRAMLSHHPQSRPSAAGAYDTMHALRARPTGRFLPCCRRPPRA